MKYIYHLEKNGVPFYIGYATYPKKREWDHIKRLDDKNISLSVIDYTDDYRQAEKYWVAQYKAWGFNLLNKNNGGGGSGTHKWTKEYKQEWDRKNWEKLKISQSELSKITRRKANDNYIKNNSDKVKQYNRQYYLSKKSKNICQI